MDNFKLIKQFFPSCITETLDKDGNIVEAIDFEKLKDELSENIADQTDERYQLTWPGKREVNLKLRRKSEKTLRPLPKESINFNDTKNLFIEGDNLEALKLLQETYLNKIKLIYIDPPYNTGKDFIYKDRFAQDKDEYLEESGFVDEEGNYLVENRETNGRYHSDWLSMMYPRLKIARNLLKEDGVIFISIDDHEVHNLRKICDEIFGSGNFVADFIRKTKSTTNDAKTGVNIQHENCICYAKNKDNILLLGGKKDTKLYKNPDNDPNGAWTSDNPSAKTGKTETGWFPVTNPHTGKIDYPPVGRFWLFSKNTMQKHIDYGTICFKKKHKDNERGFIYKRYLKDLKTQQKTFDTLGFVSNEFMNQVATKEAIGLGFVEYFNNPKPLSQIQQIVNVATKPDSKTPDLILDFFAGSGTTAHAVMQQNAEDRGNRRFILVQLDEKCNEKSEAYKAGYQNIAQISRERIKRAATQIKEKLQTELQKLKEKQNSSLELDKQTEKEIDNLEQKLQNIDLGFRTLKLDEPNTKLTRFTPQETTQETIFENVDHIKEDRTDQDLLFHTLLELKIPLTANIQEQQIQEKTVFVVNKTELLAYFGRKGEINKEFVRELAKRKLEKIAFCDNGFENDQTKINAIEMFKQLAKETQIHVI